MTNRLTQWLWRACAESGLRMDVNFTVTVSDGHQIGTVARIPNLGAPNGMLIVQNYADIQPYTGELLDKGYGFSVLEEPRADEVFDLQLQQELFRDWGWSGDVEKRPEWMK